MYALLCLRSPAVTQDMTHSESQALHISLARFLERMLVESDALPLASLAIIPGKVRESFGRCAWCWGP